MKTSSNFLNDAKLKAVIRYIIDVTTRHDPGSLGAVKLNKTLYYSDMLTYLNTGYPLTGASYKKRPFGPVCDELPRALRELEREKIVSMESVDYYGHKKKKFKLLTEVETNQISQLEKETLNEVIDFVCYANSAKTISDFSHDLVWDMVEFGETIPYHYAIHMILDTPSEDAMEWASKDIATSKNTGSKPGKATVEGLDSAAFRAHLAELH